MDKVQVAVVGCGNISGIYLKNLTEKYTNIHVYAVSDLIEENVRKAAQEYQVEKILTLEEILADDRVEIVLNLTTPPLHYDLSKKILMAGKHVYVEKPLALTYAEGKELVALAEERGLLIGCAPDTFLGSGLQTCRKIIDDGLVGDVIGASCFMMCHGHESWHPNPAFYYKIGGGPLFDMGPYYLTALVQMIGSVKSISGMASISMPTRKITSQPNYGKTIEVEVPTHVNGLLRFANGALGSLIMSFDVWGSYLPRIEVYGTRGSLVAPDPNTFGGEVLLKQYFDQDFHRCPLIAENAENCRGIGLWDMAECLRSNRKDVRASGKMALHVLEIMESIHKSSQEGTQVELESTCEKPQPLPLQL